MKKIEDLNYYELLNVSEDATLSDIHRAYLLIASAYSKDSLAAYNILSENERVDMLGRIETAYTTLSDKKKRLLYDKEVLKIEADKNTSAPILFADNIKDEEDIKFKEENEKSVLKLTDLSIFGGAQLKNIREMKGITLDEISKKTRIRSSYLKAIEEEDFDRLPEEVYIRGFLRSYAGYIGLDPEMVSKNYKFKKI